METRQVTMVASLLVLAFLRSGLSWGASADKPWGPMSEIEKAARKEGRLTIYAAPGHVSADAQQAIGPFFKERYGITIDWTTLSARDISPRVIAEQATKQYVADVAMSGIAGNYTELKPRGYVLPILAPSTLEKGVWRLDPTIATPKDRDWLYIFMPLYPSFFINTSLVRPGEEPRSYQDLLSPKWKGKIVLQIPWSGGTGSGWFRATYKKLGLDYMRALANQVALVRNVTDSADEVARGQFPIGISAETTRGQQLVSQGAPVKFLQPKEGSHLAALGMELIPNAPHANAAKLFINWFYSKEGQSLYAVKNLVISVRKDVPQDHILPDMRYIEGAPFMMPEAEDFTAQGSQEFTKVAQQIFDRGTK